eukprot:1629059-Rhodomonas_salina.1
MSCVVPVLWSRQDAKRTVIHPQRVRHPLGAHPTVERLQEGIKQVARHAPAKHQRQEREVLPPPPEAHHALRTRKPAVVTVASELH